MVAFSPAFRWIVNGKLVELSAADAFPDALDDGMSEKIVNWMVKNSGPPTSTVTCNELMDMSSDMMYTNDKTSVLAYFGSENDSLFTDVFLEHAKDEREVKVVKTDSTACAAQLNVETPSIAIFRPFDEPFVQYTGSAEKDELGRWVRIMLLPLMSELVYEDVFKVKDPEQPMLIMFRSDSEAKADFMTVFEEAAKVNRGKMIFAYSDVALDKRHVFRERIAKTIGVI